MSLYLVRHGQADSATFNPDPSLTADGRAEVDRVAHLASVYAIPVSQILYSSKIRARQTAAILNHYLKPSSGVKEIQGINPHDDVTQISGIIEPSKNIMLISHLPFLEGLLSYLILGTTDKNIITFQTAGIVCLDQNSGEESWRIKWALMPDMK